MRATLEQYLQKASEKTIGKKEILIFGTGNTVELNKNVMEK